jgi:hypothetical protein
MEQSQNYEDNNPTFLSRGFSQEYKDTQTVESIRKLLSQYDAGLITASDAMRFLFGDNLK